jgi:hypothetical protein
MIYDILFAVCGIGLIALGLSMVKLSRLVDSWQVEELRQIKFINDLYARRKDDNKRLDEAFKRIQELEDGLEAHAAELTEHHNKIDTLEINGSCYESLFEQQGLWGENSETPEFPDPEDEGIII